MRVNINPADAGGLLARSLFCLVLVTLPVLAQAPAASAEWPIGPGIAGVELLSRSGTGRNQLTVTVADGSTRIFVWHAKGSSVTLDLRPHRRAPPDRKTFDLPDQSILVEGPWTGGPRACYVRPNLESYGKARQLEWIGQWDTLPAASAHWMSLDLRPDARGFEIWIEGRYAGRIDCPRPVRLAIETGPDGACREPRFRPSGPDDSRFLPLDVGQAGTSAFEVSAWPWPEAPDRVEGIPMIVRGTRGADLGAVRHVPATAEECDFYLARSPLDRVRESVHFTLPPNLYARVHLLCLLDEAAEKSPAGIARITRYVYRRGVSCDAIMDSPFRLPRPGESLPAGVRRVGDVRVARDGTTRPAPLFLVSLPLHTGAIADLVFQPHDSPLLRKEPGLDFELLGPARPAHYASHAPYPDNSVTSGVQVLALTLERTPFEIEMTPVQPGNIFHNDEPPQLAGEIRGWQPVEVTLAWQVWDDAGRPVLQGEQAVHVPAGEIPATNTTHAVGSTWSRRGWQGPRAPFRIDLPALPAGWYAAEVTARSGGQTWVRLPMTAALLGPDTREAVADSPYASRTASIMQPPTPELHGILMEKAGIRGITPMGAALDAGESVYARWRVRGWQVPFIRSGATNPAVAEAEIATRIGDYLRKWPSARTALIFHESGGGPFPPELLDAPPPLPDDATAARDARLLELGSRTARVFRERYPSIRLQVGNSGDSLNLLAAVMRLKYPRGWIDAMGEESLGQAKMPETPHYEYGNGTALNFWHQQQLARKLGYGDLPVEPCSEWKGRMSTDLDDRTKAAWDMRDLLVAYAFGCRQIRTPDITDQGSMFYNNEYGSQGAVRRFPLLYPKRTYVATATLTRVLDRVTRRRQVPTGSSVTYVLECARAGGDYVYACWLPRGEGELAFDFGQETAARLVGMLGQETPLPSRGGRVVAPVSAAPGYLISPVAVRRVARAASRLPEPPVDWLVSYPVEAAAAWEIRPPDPARRIPRSPAHFDGIREGRFSLAPRQDPQQGTFLAWSLEDATDDPAACAGSLSLTTPVPVPGRPDTIGVLVKGNGSWARLNFRFIDAEGEVWESQGADWPANLSVNFEAWHWVCFPIDLTAAWPHFIYPNWIKGYWGRVAAPADGAGNRAIDFPIRLAGLSVILPRQTLNLTERVPVRELTLGLKAFAAGKSRSAKDSGATVPDTGVKEAVTR